MIRDFYERTARYGMEMRPEWSRVFRHPPRTLIYLVGRNIQQLNLPTSSPAAEAGMSSELIRLSYPATGATPYAGWLRRSADTGAVIYAGFYTTCGLQDHKERFVKVVFPLPNGGDGDAAPGEPPRWLLRARLRRQTVRRPRLLPRPPGG